MRTGRARVQLSQTCSVDAFRRNASLLQRSGMTQSQAFAQAFSVLSFSCERVRRSASTILIEELTLPEGVALARGLMERLLNAPDKGRVLKGMERS